MLLRRSAVIVTVSVLTLLAMCVPPGGAIGTTQAQVSSDPVDVDASDLPGDGSESDPYEISNASELQAMEDDLDANYELVTDIDASDTAQFDGGRGFDPVASSRTDEFTGTLVGNNRTVTGLTINRPDEKRAAGLFGDSSGTLTDITLTEATVTGNDTVGGLVGDNRGTIQNVTISVSVTASNTPGSAGGLVGSNFRGTIQNATASGSVNGTENVGGLVGRNSAGTIQDATASANVDGSDSSAGGLVGSNTQNGKILDVTASGNVSGVFSVGGLVGSNSGRFADGVIQNATASGRVISGGSESAGGLVGSNSGNITNATSLGGVGGGTVGGLVGVNSGNISNARASGDIIFGNEIGGLIGRNNNGGIITDVRASGSVNDRQLTEPKDSAGGLIGENGGMVQNAIAFGSVTGVEDVGGLVGLNTGTIQNATASGSVDGESRVGGLVGGHSGTIQNTSASGSVNGIEQVGGLVGNSGDRSVETSTLIQNATASGSVSGTKEVGGLVGTNSGDIADTLAVGSVAGDNNVGGTLGANKTSVGLGSVEQSYFDTQATKQSDSANDAVGLRTAEMQGSAAEQNMNLAFGETWQTVSGDYPELIAISDADPSNNTDSSADDGTDPSDGGEGGDSSNDGGSTTSTDTSIGYANGTYVSTTQSPGSTTEYLVIEVKRGSVTFGPQTDTKVRVQDASTGETLTLTPAANSTEVTVNANTEQDNDLFVIRRSGAAFGQFQIVPGDFAGEPSTVEMVESGATELLNTTRFGPFEVSIVEESGGVQAQTQAVPHGIRQPKIEGEFNSTDIAVERPNGFESSWQADLYPTNDADTPVGTLINEEDAEFLRGAVRLNNSDNVRITVFPSDANPEASATRIVYYQSPLTLNLTRVEGPVGVSEQDTDEGDGSENQTQRALQVTGKQNPSELTQNDVTAVITRFNRGQSVNNINVDQDDVTATITLFERN